MMFSDLLMSRAVRLVSLRFALPILMPLWFHAPLLAQEANILGLPAIPQPKPGSKPPTAATPASAVSAAGKANSQSAPPVNRNALAGELGLQHSARDGVGRIVFTTKTAFQTAGTRGEAIEAAKSVQQALSNSCLKQCKPLKMAEPKILASGQLEFTVAFQPLYQTLSQGQFMAVLQSRPLELTVAQLTAPVVVPAPPQVSVQVEPLPANAAPPAAPAKAP